MKNKRTKHSPAFKAKVALAALREQETVAQIARRYQVHANIVYKWRQQVLDNLPRAFETQEAGAGPTAEREAELLHKIVLEKWQAEMAEERARLLKDRARLDKELAQL